MMGQAKRRGSFEKRKAESIIREATSLGSSLGGAIAAVDPYIFMRLFEVGTAAGLSATSDGTITSESVSRALQAAIKELARMQIDGKEAYLARLSCLRAIFDSGRFSGYFNLSADGHVLIERKLLEAMAVASCNTQWNESAQSAQVIFDLCALEAKFAN